MLSTFACLYPGGDVDDDDDVPTKPPKFFENEVSYFVMDESSIGVDEADVVGDVAKILGVNPWHARTFLRLYEWEQNKLLKQWFDDSNIVLKKAGIDKETFFAMIKTDAEEVGGR